METAFEALLLPREVSERTGGAITPDAVREACRRPADAHPLPHVTMGEKRPVTRVRWSSFVTWLEEEEALSVA